jgi:hypothetical protein
MRRTPGEIVSLVATFVGAGAAVTFGVLIVGSLINLPLPLLWVAAALGIAAIAYPLLRVATREDRHE